MGTKLGSILAGVVLLTACGGDGDRELRVDLRTDWVPAAEFTEVEVTIEDGGPSIFYAADLDDDFLRGIRVATFEGAPQGTVVVRARLLAADGRRIAQRRVQAVVSSSLTITIPIARSCEGLSCPDGADPSATECFNGRCVAPGCSPENPVDCGDAACESSADCGDAPVGCARSVCSSGECFVGSDFSACASSEYCHPELGCTPRPSGDGDGGPRDGGTGMDGGTDPSCGQPCDTGEACATGVYDCSGGAPVCVRDSILGAGTVCRPSTGACDVAESCDGTGAECPMDASAPTGTPCSAGFCDGLGACSDTCTPGASCSTGDPCETGAIDCSSGSPICVRSGNAPNGTSCAATQTGAWGSCGGFSGSCDETGTRSRSVTDWQCSSGTCAPDTSSETGVCSRSTTGTMCGATVTGTWSACSYGSTCAESGTRTRTDTLRQCSSGSCADVPDVVDGTCTRDTDGTSCSSILSCTERECVSGTCQVIASCPAGWTCCPGDGCFPGACP